MDSQTSALVGQRIGNYQIVRKLGEGGMGAVFEAMHDSIGRRAAVKVLHSAFTRDPAIVTRFFNEARAVNIVQHPGLVGIFDFGQLPDGTAYIVMDYLDGATLTRRLADSGGRMGTDAFRFGRQIASALAAAHAKGIIHRDLKPDNVVVVRDPEAAGGERAKILDFGIAKLAEDQVAPGPAGSGGGVTSTGAVMGTPLYMSPEQCRGAGGVDAQADVYSLGAMLYHLLSGRPPFHGEGVGELLGKHMYEMPVALSALEPNIPPDAEALVHAMLAKDPAERPTMAQTEAFLAVLDPGGARVSANQLPALPRQSGASFPRPTTTLGGSVGQSRASGSSAGRRWLVPVVVLGLAAAGIAIFVMRTRGGNGGDAGTAVKGGESKPVQPPAGADPRPQPAGTPAPVAPAPAPALITWSVSTDPAGAEVVRVSDGVSVGVTPWHDKHAPAPGTLQLVLRHPGYLEQPLTLDRSTDFNGPFKLEPVPVEHVAVTKTHKTDHKTTTPVTTTPTVTTPPKDDFEERLKKAKQQTKTGTTVKPVN